MTNKQVEEMHIDIANVLAKHGVAGFSGVWFEGDTGDYYGFLNGVSPTADNKLKFVVAGVTEAFNDFTAGARAGAKQVGQILVVAKFDIKETDPGK